MREPALDAEHDRRAEHRAPGPTGSSAVGAKMRMRASPPARAHTRTPSLTGSCSRARRCSTSSGNPALGEDRELISLQRHVGEDVVTTCVRATHATVRIARARPHGGRRTTTTPAATLPEQPSASPLRRWEPSTITPASVRRRPRRSPSTSALPGSPGFALGSPPALPAMPRARRSPAPPCGPRWPARRSSGARPARIRHLPAATRSDQRLASRRKLAACLRDCELREVRAVVGEQRQAGGRGSRRGACVARRHVSWRHVSWRFPSLAVRRSGGGGLRQQWRRVPSRALRPPRSRSMSGVCGRAPPSA